MNKSIKQNIKQDCVKVSLIIPFRDKIKLLRNCLKSILEKTDFPNYEIILVNNNSKKKKTFSHLIKIKENKKIKIFQYNKPFNFSAINNFAAEQAQGEFLLFLNNDTEVISPSWMRVMAGQLKFPEVGVVGAKLLYLNGMIQHAGIKIGKNIATNAFANFHQNDKTFLDHCSCIRKVTAVTAACMMTKKKLFMRLGGFDAKNLPIAYNDVDYCLRVREKGYEIVFTPEAELYHFESKSRGSDILNKFLNPKRYKKFLAEQEYMKRRWSSKILRGEQYIK